MIVVDALPRIGCGGFFRSVGGRQGWEVKSGGLVWRPAKVDWCRWKAEIGHGGRQVYSKIRYSAVIGISVVTMGNSIGPVVGVDR